uniref:Uncharacterized protein n=1 Tax=Arundo donax TaxID=35708 RepID=A0A0A8YF15_ARUDO
MSLTVEARFHLLSLTVEAREEFQRVLGKHM